MNVPQYECIIKVHILVWEFHVGAKDPFLDIGVIEQHVPRHGNNDNKANIGSENNSWALSTESAC